MPTTKPRHQVTETSAVAHALDVAARRWPGRPRSQLLVELVQVGGRVLEREQAELVRARREAVQGTSGKYAGAFAEGYLSELRADWPQ